MKRMFAVILALAVIVLMSIIETSAYSAPRMKVNIGFPFYISESQLPAGEYLIEWVNVGSGGMVGSAPAIRSLDGSIFQFLPARAQGSYKSDPSCYAVFNRIGGSYFLSRIHQSAIEINLPKSRKQKEIASAYPEGSQKAAAAVVIFAADSQK